MCHWPLALKSTIRYVQFKTMLQRLECAVQCQLSSHVLTKTDEQYCMHSNICCSCPAAVSGHVPSVNWLQRSEIQASKHWNNISPGGLAAILWAWGRVNFTPSRSHFFWIHHAYVLRFQSVGLVFSGTCHSHIFMAMPDLDFFAAKNLAWIHSEQFLHTYSESWLKGQPCGPHRVPTASQCATFDLQRCD